MNIQLPKTLAAWPGDDFERTFRDELANLPYGALPLHQAMSLGSQVAERPPRVILLSSKRDAAALTIRAGIFFNSVLGGCSCADDPTPMDENNEYCEMTLVIDPQDGDTRVILD